MRHAGKKAFVAQRLKTFFRRRRRKDMAERSDTSPVRSARGRWAAGSAKVAIQEGAATGETERKAGPHLVGKGQGSSVARRDVESGCRREVVIGERCRN